MSSTKAKTNSLIFNKTILIEKKSCFIIVRPRLSIDPGLYCMCCLQESWKKKKTEENKKELQEVTESLAAAQEISLISPGAAVLSTLEHLHYKKNIK